MFNCLTLAADVQVFMRLSLIFFRLSNSERRNIRGNRLRLLNASVHDNGIYSCRAENEAGSAFSDKNFMLNIPCKFLTSNKMYVY